MEFPSSDNVVAALESMGITVPFPPPGPAPVLRDRAFRDACDLRRTEEKISKLPSPGPRGPAFDRLWFVFQELFSLERARDSQEMNFDEYQGATKKIIDAGREFAVARGLFESERRPPTVAGSRWYVSAQKGDMTSLLVGPLDTHEAALRLVPDAKSAARDVDRDAYSYSYGTCAVPPLLGGVARGSPQLEMPPPTRRNPVIRRIARKALNVAEDAVYLYAAAKGTYHLAVGGAHWFVANWLEGRHTTRANVQPGEEE